MSHSRLSLSVRRGLLLLAPLILLGCESGPATMGRALEPVHDAVRRFDPSPDTYVDSFQQRMVVTSSRNIGPGYVVAGVPVTRGMTFTSRGSRMHVSLNAADEERGIRLFAHSERIWGTREALQPTENSPEYTLIGMPNEWDQSRFGVRPTNRLVHQDVITQGNGVLRTALWGATYPAQGASLSTIQSSCAAGREYIEPTGFMTHEVGGPAIPAGQGPYYRQAVRVVVCVANGTQAQADAIMRRALSEMPTIHRRVQHSGR